MHAAGISYRQLDYWARTGLVEPSIRPAAGSGSQRLYSFRDLVVLRVVKSLLEAGVSLQNIRRAIDTLRAHGVEDLAGITLISDGTTVYECRSAEEIVDLLQGGQGVFGIAIGGAFKEIKGSLSHLPADPAPAAPETGPPEVGTPRAATAGGGELTDAADELAARRARRRAG
jgi:DNA-binding transcriptional MerR regulator